MVRRLNELFGDHTFFLDSNGLNVVCRQPDSGLAVEQKTDVRTPCIFRPQAGRKHLQ
jgi:hypothetical protein